jgi:hypothetical protein
VLLASGPPCLDVPVSEESSSTVDEKPEDVDTWRRYDVAPKDALQLIVGLVETAAAPSTGDVRVGALGAATTVVNVNAGE